MGRNRLPHKFGTIPKKLWEMLEGKEKQFLFKYDYFIRKTYEIDDEILDLQSQIKELKEKKEYYRKRSEDIWVTNQHLKEEYSPKYNISKNDKKNRRYWLINVKYKKRTKSIHIGSDDYIKDFLKNNDWVKENKDFLEIDDLNNLTESNIKQSVDKLIGDNLYEVIISTTNFFEESVKFTDLVD